MNSRLTQRGFRGQFFAAWSLFCSPEKTCSWTGLWRLAVLWLLVGILWTLWLLSLQRGQRLKWSFSVSGDFLFVCKFYDLTSRMDFSKFGANWKRFLRLWNSRQWVGNRLSAGGKSLVHRASFWCWRAHTLGLVWWCWSSLLVPETCV